MSKTNAQLRNQVAEDLGIKAIDQELSDEGASRIENRISTVHAHYLEKGLFWWADSAIPDSVFEGLSMVICAHVCASVRKAGQGHEEKLLPGLAMIAAVKPSATVDTMKTFYF